MNTPEILNPSQRQAVEYEDGNLLIVAGPGTGKTHTLLHRILRIQKNAAGCEILAVTFTNKAAQDMHARLQFYGGSLENIFVGTFHSFCLKILREFHNAANLPMDFRVALPEEVAVLTAEIWPHLSIHDRNELLKKISREKSQPNPKASADLTAFNLSLRQHNWLDFDDILQETNQLFKNNGAIAQKIREHYCSIFVDEYQDINAVQHALLKNLVQDGVVLTAIGDPNQAIYGFRGSDVRHFESFAKDFQPAGKLYLSENYRSTKNLLTASTQVIEKENPFEMLDVTAKIYSEGRLTIYEAPTDNAEAEYIVHQIEKMLGGTSMFSQDSGRVGNGANAQRSFGDIAIFYRLNAQKHTLKKALERSGIPYQVSGEEVGRKRIDQCQTQQERDQRALEQYEETILYNAEKVSLMTLHASKGLEFPVVFIVGCEETILPLELDDLKGDIQEERRIFYVGMTRAKECLYLLCAKKRQLFGKTRQNEASRFLSDIQEDLKAYEFAEHKKKKLSLEKQLDLFSL